MSDVPPNGSDDPQGANSRNAHSRRAEDFGVNDRRANGRGELGALLVSARTERGLTLANISETTHVRQEYLRALEEGRFDALPEDVYTRNFVRLYAGAVGVPAAEALDAYQRERRMAGGLTTIEERLAVERRGEPPPAARPTRRSGGPRLRLGPTALTLLLVAALVGLAVWGYNSLFFTGTTADRQQPPPQAPPQQSQREAGGTPAGDAPGAPAGNQADALPGAETSGTVLIDVASTPPGASVSIDGFNLPGSTPIVGAPVTARSGRVVRITLEGFEPWEETVDLTERRSIDATLLEAAASGAPESGESSVPAGQLSIRVTAPSWLEVYQSTARNQGERLVYTTAQPGASYTFDLPVFVYVGNAAGVEITLADEPPFAMGSSGAIEGRAFE